MKGELMLKTIHALAIIALLAFITCCVFWLVERPNRYQPLSALNGYYAFDTETGTIASYTLTGTAAGEPRLQATFTMKRFEPAPQTK
jgi:hypothetical protein